MIPWVHSSHNPHSILISAAVFAQMTAAQSVPILYNGMPLYPLKIAASHGGSGPHLI